jgi:TPR repeat protein
MVLWLGLIFCLLLAMTSVHATLLTNNSEYSQTLVQSAGYARAVERQQYLKANQAYDNGDIYLARRMWYSLAEQGYGDAAFKVGMLYDRGETFPHDASQAAFWYIKAAKAGNIYAQHNLGVAYANGDGVETSIDKAVEWWLKAAAHGNVDSQYNLGIVYSMGTRGYRRDARKAMQWWRRAALNGDAMAQYNLGALYANGDTQMRNVCEAVHWLQQSASRGVTQANLVLEAIKGHREASHCH